jgi:hypothetical protein
MIIIDWILYSILCLNFCMSKELLYLDSFLDILTNLLIELSNLNLSTYWNRQKLFIYQACIINLFETDLCLN